MADSFDAETDAELADHDLADKDLVDALRLNLVPGLGPRTTQVLLEAFGSPRAILNANPEEWLAVDGVGPKLSNALAKARTSDAATAELDRCREQNIQLFRLGAEDYPTALAETPDPPPLLYCRGTLTPADTIAVGIVGSRSGTLYGKQQAERFGRELARAGVTVISGLARGIDAAAHRGALEAGGRTLAVIAPGLTKLYPPEHVDLARDIVANGAVLTESPLDRSPSQGLFPQRNRIISGMSCGVLIIEAARKSGALHTARHAMEQNRDVFALPGRITDPTSVGCLDLIRDGATLVRDVDDILNALGPLQHPVAERFESPPATGRKSGPTDNIPDYERATPQATRTVHSPRELTLSDQERTLLEHVPTDPVPVDQVLANSGLAASQALSTLTVLEMKRFVQRMPGGYIVRRAT